MQVCLLDCMAVVSLFQSFKTSMLWHVNSNLHPAEATFSIYMSELLPWRCRKVCLGVMCFKLNLQELFADVEMLDYQIISSVSAVQKSVRKRKAAGGGMYDPKQAQLDVHGSQGASGSGGGASGQRSTRDSNTELVPERE